MTIATVTKLCSVILLFAFSTINNIQAQQTMYWVGGTGDWTDVSHWANSSGGSTTFGFIPDENYNVVIDSNSGLSTTSVITIPAGDYGVNDFSITNTSGFELHLAGIYPSIVTMNVYGNILFNNSFTLTYAEQWIAGDRWVFNGEGQQDITSGGQDLLHIEFYNGNTTYKQLDDLKASEQIRFHGGTWDTENHEVRSKSLLFQDSNPSSSPIPKLFNAGTSDIHCVTWMSRLSYLSLTVTGNHKIYTKQFLGSPGSASQPFSFNEIHLLDLEDTPSGATSPIEYNNFDCPYCEVQRLIIEDTSRVLLAGIFTIQDYLEVTNHGVNILFNGGNGRPDEVIINGDIITPQVVDCDQRRTVFSNIYNDFTTLTRASGTLTIDASEINNIQAQGGAVFQVENSVLQGFSEGWTVVNPPTAIAYQWRGTLGSLANWNNPNNWRLYGGGFNGCIPSIVDDVYVTNDALGPIRIPSPYTAACRNFTWTNTKDLVLKLDGQPTDKSELLIAGDFELNDNATITAVDNHELIFSSATTNSIITNDVSLPDVHFRGATGRWNLNDSLTCTKLDLESGTMDTQNHDITTNLWRSLEEYPKHYIFGSSHITVNGEMLLAQLPADSVTVDFGTSMIACEKLTSSLPELYDVRMINTGPLVMHNWPVTFNSLTLASAARVETAHNMTIGNLIFEADNAKLALDHNWDFNILRSIESLSSNTSPAKMRSLTTGIQADVHKATGNLCALGPIEYSDINADLPGVMHSAEGTDITNNTGINFDSGDTSTDLYWIGATDSNWTTKANWSRISGGCPDSLPPSGLPDRYFDENSFFVTANTINVPTSTTAGNVYFYHYDEHLTIHVTNQLTAQNITVRGEVEGQSFIQTELTFLGDFVDILGSTDLLQAGILRTGLQNYSTELHNIEYSAWVVMSGSLGTVKN